MEGKDVDAAPQPRRFVGRKTIAQDGSTPSTSTSSAVVPKADGAAPRRVIRQQVPEELLNDEKLARAISVLPSNYNFEVHKTIWRIKQAGAKRVALQFPEGLLMYACVLSDILEAYAGVDHCFILGDVAYGACCVDDYGALALECDFLVHYGHSCLVPVDVTSIPCMYVFVDIALDLPHLVSTVKLNFPDAATRLVLAGTIQFASSLSTARQQLGETYASLKVPQAKPLSPGEVLGCTAPVLQEEADAIVFVADGRFHLESLMIANPTIPAYRYDPYGRSFTRERYDHVGMRAARRAAVERATGATRWGLVLGTLGRQGNPRVVDTVAAYLRERNFTYTTYLMSEVSPPRLAAIEGVDAWVQVACPRLSIDWGEGFSAPVLTPYEALVCLGVAPPFWDDSKPPVASESDAGIVSFSVPYPQDYYSKDGGEWAGSYHRTQGAPGGEGRPGPLAARRAAAAAAAVAAAGGAG